jgi:hypothetical protein
MVFCKDKTYIGIKVRVLSIYYFVLEIMDIFYFFHSAVIKCAEECAEDKQSQCRQTRTKPMQAYQYIAISGPLDKIHQKLTMKRSNGSSIDKKMFKFLLPSLKQKIDTALTESTQSDKYFEYLGKFDLISETN